MVSRKSFEYKLLVVSKTVNISYETVTTNDNLTNFFVVDVEAEQAIVFVL